MTTTCPAAVNKGTAEFAWVGDGITWWWSDCPYHPARDADSSTPELPPGHHLPVYVILVDASTGTIKAMRMATWPPDFAKAVVTSVGRLAGN